MKFLFGVHLWLIRLEPGQQAFLIAGIGLIMQYSLNILAYFELLPDIAGISLNGVVRNTAFLIFGFLAVIGSLYFEGLEGIKRLFRPYTIVFFNPLYWFFACLILVPLLYLSILLDDLLYLRSPEFHALNLPTVEAVIQWAPIFLQVAICDELFWIGFIYPRLIHAGYRPLKASMLIGILWGLDYIPYLFNNFLVANQLNISSLLFGWLALTPIYVWLYHRTGSAILLLVFNVFMQFEYGILPILPHDTGDNNLTAMSNLVCFSFGILLWKIAPGTLVKMKAIAVRPKFSPKMSLQN
jgi:hypothetical protein